MKCIKCDEDLDNVTYWWDESGYGYSAKMCRCSRCGTIQYLEIVEDKGSNADPSESFFHVEGLEIFPGEMLLQRLRN